MAAAVQGARGSMAASSGPAPSPTARPARASQTRRGGVSCLLVIASRRGASPSCAWTRARGGRPRRRPAKIGHVPTQAVIFVMDGVLVDSEPLHFATTNVVLARRGAAIDRDFYDRRLGLPEVDFFRDVVRHTGLAEAPEVLAAERIRESIAALAGPELLPMDGALECLLMLRADGRWLALASSASRAQVTLVAERFALRSVLSALVAVEEVARGKPAPDLFLEAARRLQVAP